MDHLALFIQHIKNVFKCSAMKSNPLILTVNDLIKDRSMSFAVRRYDIPVHTIRNLMKCDFRYHCLRT